MYLTYEEYQGLGGTKGETDFRLLEYAARGRIDELTWCRVRRMAEVPEAVKMAMMHLVLYAEKFGPTSLTKSPAVASFNTDGYSESYGSVESQEATARRALDEAVIAILNGVEDDYGVPLLHLGVGGRYPMYGWTDEGQEGTEG